MSRQEMPAAAAAATTQEAPRTPVSKDLLDTFLVRAYPGAYPEKEKATKANEAAVAGNRPGNRKDNSPQRKDDLLT